MWNKVNDETELRNYVVDVEEEHTSISNWTKKLLNRN
jgi:hypothetical protein